MWFSGGYICKDRGGGGGWGRCVGFGVVVLILDRKLVCICLLKVMFAKGVVYRWLSTNLILNP